MSGFTPGRKYRVAVYLEGTCLLSQDGNVTFALAEGPEGSHEHGLITTVPERCVSVAEEEQHPWPVAEVVAHLDMHQVAAALGARLGEGIQGEQLC